MSYSGIEHKLRVFISSKCDGKYAIARKALKTLLEATGLVKVYVFETEPASSEDTKSSYLQFVDDSNLCVFLVDNADGVPPAVLSEERRAKGKNLRLLYLFCDETKKEATPMQEEIKASMSQKYLVVNKFSDIVPKAYESVMQDIIAVYKTKAEPFSDENSSELEGESKTTTLDTDNYALIKVGFTKFPEVSKVLTTAFSSNNSPNDDSTVLEKDLCDHLNAILCLKPCDLTVIDGIRDEVLKDISKDISDVLLLRYQAQREYYRSDYDKCLSTLQDAIKTSLGNSNIPKWISNDIAIDIRHVQRQIDEHNNIFTIDNPGQKYIDESDQPVFFPYLDRNVENMQENIADEYYSQLNSSPYTTKVGGIEKLFTPLANAFCIAEIHGSIVQTEITRDRLISIYSLLCSFYSDHNFIVEYTRLLIINRECKKIDTLIRKSNQLIGKLNDNDIELVINSIANITDPIHKMMSKYLLASRLGYYMSDEKYSDLYKELVEYSFIWIDDDKRILALAPYIFDFYSENTFRAKTEDIIGFVRSIFSKGFQRYYMDCFKVLRHVDYTYASDSEQQTVLKMFIDIVTNVDVNILDTSFSSAVIRFCKSTDISFDELESLLEHKLPEFYNKTFLLELSDKKKQDQTSFIEIYLSEAHSRNLSQGKNGAYSGYSHESLDVIYNIIKLGDNTLTEELLKSILEVSLETLKADKQTVKAKMTAVKLLQLLHHLYQSNSIWEDAKKQLIDNLETYSTGSEVGFFMKETNQLLSFQYNLFIGIFLDSRIDISIDKLYSVNTTDSFEIIQTLKVILSHLEDTDKKDVKDQTLLAFLSFCILMTQNSENEIKYNAIRCLVELTNYISVKRVALMQLSKVMDYGSQAEKIAVLSRVGKICSDEDDYVVQIINKGKSDNNYLVRYIATREAGHISKPVDT